MDPTRRLRERLPRLIRAACSRQLDAVTFTSAPAALALLTAADDLGLRADLVDAMRNHVAAVAVGPVTAGPLCAAGIPVVVPERHRLGALIRLGHRGAGRTARPPVPERGDLASSCAGGACWSTAAR